MIFQEPMSALNPCYTVGFQIEETPERASRPFARRRGGPARSISWPRSGSPIRQRRLKAFPASAVGRHEPARHDRHGDRLPAQTAHRRRADDGARRDDPGADPRPAARSSGATRAWASCSSRTTWASWPRPRRAFRSITRAGRSRRTQPKRCSPTGTTPIPRRCWRLCRSGRRAGGCRRSRALCPGQFDRPPACVFEPRCAFAFDYCRTHAPVPASPDLGHALCHIPLVEGQPTPLVLHRRRSARMSASAQAPLLEARSSGATTR